MTFASTLRDKFGYTADRMVVLADTESAGVGKATRENVQRALADLRKRITKDDQLLVLLIGHGTSIDGDEAKFNLVGPDLSATEWADLIRPIPGRVVFVDTTGASFPFLRTIAGHGRIVLTATDAAAQQFETVFPEFFVKAFDDPAADLDKNGRVSLWEAFTYASAGVRQWFEQKGQLPTERPLLDDTGSGIGREAQNPGTDGAVARVTYLEPDATIALPADAALAGAAAAPRRSRDAARGAQGAQGVDAARRSATPRSRSCSIDHRQISTADPDEVNRSRKTADLECRGAASSYVLKSPAGRCRLNAPSLLQQYCSRISLHVVRSLPLAEHEDATPRR